jgi:hypothetical protein
MSDPGSTSTENTGSPKKKISPARNIIGAVVLAGVVVAGFFQYSAVFAYNRAVKALDVRTQDEEKGLMEVPEVESLVGKSPDAPGSDFVDGSRTFTKTKYTWRGPLKSYTLTAYYTKGDGPCLHHFETDGATYVPEPLATSAPSDAIATAPAPQKAKGTGGPTMAPFGAATKKKAAASGKGAAPKPAAEQSKADASAAPAKAAEPAADTPKAATSPPTDAAEATKPAPPPPPGAAKPPE